MRADLDYIQGIVLKSVAAVGLCSGLPGCAGGTEPVIPPPPQPAAYVAPATQPSDVLQWLERKAEAAFVARRLPAAAKARYVISFKCGYRAAVTSPVAGIYEYEPDGKPVISFADGVAAGKSDAPLPIDNFIALFEAIGYTRQTVTGNYAVGYEESSLQISGEPRRWWLSETPYLVQSPKPGSLVVTGLVSPLGIYGHLGGYSHDILALEIRSAP